MAHSRYQYGTSPRKVEPDYTRRPKKQQSKPLRVINQRPRPEIRVSAEQKKRQSKMIAVAITLFLVLLAISCRNSQIDNKFNQIQDQKKQLAALQKENEQLKISIENSMNLSNIEKVAKEELGMQKLTSQQTVYISLPKKDYVESKAEKIIVEENKNLWEKIVDKILNIKN